MIVRTQPRDEPAQVRSRIQVGRTGYLSDFDLLHELFESFSQSRTHLSVSAGQRRCDGSIGLLSDLC
jgi:hypothetical protein